MTSEPASPTSRAAALWDAKAEVEEGYVEGLVIMSSKKERHDVEEKWWEQFTAGQDRVARDVVDCDRLRPLAAATALSEITPQAADGGLESR